ncbi:unnamed protein product [Vitrella brassicaformis CCMP3155]|uniref:Uncharacterized protein n=3 Tax=Vitrella brassicaformis TaxID=1169539 RepID=A0A0G4EKD6_VITBC|nr:unnamed protein product [Vitrella brassicaformis CCMP3155]|eukprot:CEL97020.1 unnamed protein product [Vitrella brassicaformis CCMP3155]
MPKGLPGLYWDEEKKRYFPIALKPKSQPAATTAPTGGPSSLDKPPDEGPGPPQPLVNLYGVLSRRRRGLDGLSASRQYGSGSSGSWLNSHYYGCGVYRYRCEGSSVCGAPGSIVRVSDSETACPRVCLSHGPAVYISRIDDAKSIPRDQTTYLSCYSLSQVTCLQFSSNWLAIGSVGDGGAPAECHLINFTHFDSLPFHDFVRQMGRMEFGNALFDLDLQADENRLVLGGTGLGVYDLHESQQVWHPRHRYSDVLHVASLPSDKNTLITAHRSGNVLLWDTRASPEQPPVCLAGDMRRERAVGAGRGRVERGGNRQRPIVPRTRLDNRFAVLGPSVSCGHSRGGSASVLSSSPTAASCVQPLKTLPHIFIVSHVDGRIAMRDMRFCRRGDRSDAGAVTLFTSRDRGPSSPHKRGHKETAGRQRGRRAAKWQKRSKPAPLAGRGDESDTSSDEDGNAEDEMSDHPPTRTNRRPSPSPSLSPIPSPSPSPASLPSFRTYCGNTNTGEFRKFTLDAQERLLVFPGSDGVVRLWSVSHGGHPVRELPTYTSAPTSRSLAQRAWQGSGGARSDGVDRFLCGSVASLDSLRQFVSRRKGGKGDEEPDEGSVSGRAARLELRRAGRPDGEGERRRRLAAAQTRGGSDEPESYCITVPASQSEAFTVSRPGQPCVPMESVAGRVPSFREVLRSLTVRSARRGVSSFVTFSHEGVCHVSQP